MEKISQANVTYWISGIDMFYTVSTKKFENLITYQAIEVANPKLDVYNLENDRDVVILIRCKCPIEEQIKKGMKLEIILSQTPNFHKI